MSQANEQQAALGLGAADLFPPRGVAAAVGWADYCYRKVMAMLRSPAPRAAVEWSRFTVVDRAWIARLAGVADSNYLQPVALIADWNAIKADDRARMLAAFERLRQWIGVHAEFSIGTDEAEYSEQQLVLMGVKPPPGKNERESLGQPAARNAGKNISTRR